MQAETNKGLPQAFDLTVALFGLLVTMPIIGFAGLAIALTSRGGVLFRQKRVGQGGRLFILYKLRTMGSRAAGPEITRSNDSRVTRVGRFLRATKLDELPTLWNVLKGDMAFVGPRPEVPRYVRLEDPMWEAVLRAKPGITDPVTVRLRNEEHLLEKIEGDMERYYLDELQPLKLQGYVAYLEQRSWWTDLKVLWQTLLAIPDRRVGDLSHNDGYDSIAFIAETKQKGR